MRRRSRVGSSFAGDGGRGAGDLGDALVLSFGGERGFRAGDVSDGWLARSVTESADSASVNLSSSSSRTLLGPNFLGVALAAPFAGCVPFAACGADDPRGVPFVFEEGPTTGRLTVGLAAPILEDARGLFGGADAVVLDERVSLSPEAPDFAVLVELKPTASRDDIRLETPLSVGRTGFLFSPTSPEVTESISDTLDLILLAVNGRVGGLLIVLPPVVLEAIVEDRALEGFKGAPDVFPAVLLVRDSNGFFAVVLPSSEAIPERSVAGVNILGRSRFSML